MRDDRKRLFDIGSAGLALGATLLAEGTARAAGGRLLVFLHVAAKQRALQSTLQATLGGFTVTAVGRLGDLERALQDGQDAMLSLPLVLAQRNLAVAVQGVRANAPDETYALVGTGAAPKPLEVKVVGTLDLLGRDGTTSFVHGLVGGKPKVERVTKIEDLLPLLQMQLVDAVVLPTRLVPDLKAASRLELVQVELEKRVGLPAVASVGPAGADVVAAVRALPAEVSKMLGVDAWR